MPASKAQNARPTRSEILEELLDISRLIISTQDLQTLLQKIASTAGLVLGASIVVLYTYREEVGDVSLPPVTWGEIRKPAVLEQRSQVRPHKESAVFRVLEKRGPVYAPNAGDDWGRLVDGWSHQESFICREGIVSSAATPLIAEDQRVGVLFINYRSYHTFSKSERRTIEFLASQAAIAIQSARLLQGERVLRQQAEMLRSVAGVISSDLDLKRVAGTILDELRNVTDYRKASMQLIREDIREMIAYRDYAAGAINEWDHPEWVLPRLSDDRLVSRVIEGRMPLILSYSRDDPDWKVHPGTADVMSWVGLPLFFGDRPVGLVTIDHDQPGFYTVELNDLLVAFGRQVATAIENARLFGDAQRRIRDLQILNNITQVVATRVDIQGLMSALVSHIADQLRCSHCTIFVPQEEKGETLLVPRDSYGPGAPAVLTRRFKIDEGLAGWVFQHGESLVLDDVAGDERFLPARMNRGQPRSMLVVPVKVGNRTIGIISADQDAYGWFSESDRRLVDSLAQQVGIAILREQGLQLYQKIAARISRGEKVEDVMRHIVSGAIELTGTTAGVIYLLSTDARSIVDSFEFPPRSDHPTPRMEGEGGITRQIAATGKAMVVADVLADPRVNRAIRRSARSMVGIPLSLDEKVIGVLYLNDEEFHDFSETEVSLLSTLAGQAAVAIRTAQLFQEAEQRADELRLLHDVSEQFMTLDLNQLLFLIVQGAVTLTATKFGHIYRLSKDGTRILDPVAYPVDSPHPDSHTSPGGLTRQIFETGEPIFVRDTSLETRVNRDVRNLGIRSFVGCPLQAADQVIGVLYLNDIICREFSDAERLLVSTLARQASIALANAALFSDVQRQVKGHRTLNAVGTRLIGMLDENEILVHVARSAADALDCTHCTVFTSQGDLLVVRTSQGNRDWSFLENRAFKIGQGIAGWVASTGKAEMVGDTLLHPHFERGWSSPQPDPSSLLVVPVFLGGEIYGVISAEHDRIDAFDEHDLMLLRTLASQMSQAVQNARLFETRQRLNSQLERLYQVVQEQKLEEVLERIVEGIRAILGKGTSPTINLYNQETGKFGDCHAAGPLADQLRVPPRSSGTGAYVVESREALYLEDVHNPLPGQPTVRVASKEMGIRSFAAIPLKSQERIVGVLFINSVEPLTFLPETKRVLQLFAAQAAVAIDVSQVLKRKIAELDVLKNIGRAVSSLGINQILDQVYEQMGRIIDLRNAQVQFAFYDQELNQVVFPLAVEQDDGRWIDTVRWGEREPAFRWPGESQIVEQLQPRTMGTRFGLTEYVIETRQEVLLVEEFNPTLASGTDPGPGSFVLDLPAGDAAQDRKRVHVWRSFGRLSRPTNSWLGVPMSVHDRVVGIISVQSLGEERPVDEDQLQVLKTVASQAAVAVENARLFKERTEAWQKARQEAITSERQRIEAEKWAYLGKLAGNLAHRIGNKGGMIRLCVHDLAELLDSLQLRGKTLVEVTEHLDTIQRNNQYLLSLSNFLFKPRKAVEETRGMANVHDYLEDAIKYADVPVNVQVERHYDRSLPLVVGNKYLVEVFMELIVNAVEAMERCREGKLTITTAPTDGHCVQVLFQDTGPGIAVEDRDLVFELFAQANDRKLSREALPDEHQGFGLWWVRMFLREIGGDISVGSDLGAGTIFTVRLPLAEDGDEG